MDLENLSQTLIPSTKSLTSSIGLLFLVGAAVINLLLAFVVYRSDPKSSTNKIFSLLSISVIFWLSTYTVYLPELSLPPLLMSRLGIFFAAPMSALFFLLAYTIPDRKLKLHKDTLFIIIISTLIVMVLNISPYGFSKAILVDGGLNITPGIGFIPFILFSTLLSFLAVYILFRKFQKSSGESRQQIKLVLTGILLMLTLVIITIPIPIIFLQSGIFIPLMPVYTLVFLAATAYAITKYRLFDIKVILTQAITIVIWITLFSKIFVAETLIGKAVDSIIFLITLIFGRSLVRSVRNEIQQREKIQKLAGELEKTNVDLEKANARLKELDQMKSEFISLATHQIRAPLTAIKGYASLILEGDFGEVNTDAKGAIKTIMDSSDNLVSIVSDFLDVSRIEQGRMKYDFTQFDVAKLAEQIVTELKPNIDDKKLKLNLKVSDGDYMVNADQVKIKQVIGNFIDNSIKYTPKGSINVDVKRENENVHIIVSDTGVGIPTEEINKLFDKFVRAKDAVKTNVQGTGLGLYIAKQMIEVHGGRVWAESAGLNKGSQFHILLPVKHT